MELSDMRTGDHHDLLKSLLPEGGVHNIEQSLIEGRGPFDKRFDCWAVHNGWLHRVTVEIRDPAQAPEERIPRVTRESVPLSAVHQVTGEADGTWQVRVTSAAPDEPWRVPPVIAEAITGLPSAIPSRPDG